MTQNNKIILSRILFLGLLVAAIFAVFLIGRGLSKEEVGAVVKSKEGKAVLVEYSDFQCPACGMYYPLVKQLKKEFGDKLTVTYKHFPLRNIHKNAELAARASEAALDQGKFWEMHDILFERQEEWSDSTQASSLFTAYAISLGIEQNNFLADMDSVEIRDKVNEDYMEGVRLKVGGTPTFFLNEKKLTNPKSYEEFVKLIADSLK